MSKLCLGLLVGLFAVLFFAFFTSTVVLSVLLDRCNRPTSPTLPRLKEQPEIEDVTTSTIRIAWKKDHHGDGDICGYIVNLKSPSSISWSSVGFVLFSEEETVYRYTIDRLDAKRLYGISVAILHCSGGQGEMSSELRQATMDYTLPTLSEAPQSTSLTSSSVALRWTNQYEGDGPMCGYVIFIRVNGDEEPWLRVGFVPVDADLEYETDHLQANTTYQVAVALNNCFSAREGPLDPILQIKTLPIARTTEPRTSESMSTTPQIPPVVQNCTNEFLQPKPNGEFCKYIIYWMSAAPAEMLIALLLLGIVLYKKLRVTEYSGCFNCGEMNHSRSSCRFNTKIQCHKCMGYGHKAKFCPTSDYHYD